MRQKESDRKRDRENTTNDHMCRNLHEDIISIYIFIFIHKHYVLYLGFSNYVYI